MESLEDQSHDDAMQVDQSEQMRHQETEAEAIRRKIELGRQLAEDQKAKQLIEQADAQNYRQSQSKQPPQQQQFLQVQPPAQPAPTQNTGGNRRPRSGRRSGSAGRVSPNKQQLSNDQ